MSLNYHHTKNKAINQLINTFYQPVKLSVVRCLQFRKAIGEKGLFALHFGIWHPLSKYIPGLYSITSKFKCYQLHLKSTFIDRRNKLQPKEMTNDNLK